jgi:RimJ/RimL family protein N-acetyltransferase
MPIESKRLNLRLYRNEDFDFLASMLSDPEMVRFIGNGQVRDYEGAKRFLDWIYSTYKHGLDMGLMVLVTKDDNVLIGHAGLVPQTIDDRKEIEIGYWIAREYWGQGYATESALALRDYGSHQLGIKRFISLIQPGNIASRRVAEAIGMSVEKEIKLAGQDVYVYTISY